MFLRNWFYYKSREVLVLPYHIKDSHYPGTIIKEIEKFEYESIKNFSELFYLYEGVLFAFSNYHNAKLDYEGFEKSLETFNSKASLGEIQSMSIYPITTEIIFFNTFLDNTKNFNSTIKSKKIENKISELNKIEAIKILRAVRNYSIHASVPVKTTSVTRNLLDNTKKYKFYIEKEIIIKNSTNQRDLKNLRKFKSNKIILNNMIQEVSNELEKLNLVTFEEFIKIIPKEVKDILIKYVRSTETGEKYFANIFTKSKLISESKERKGFTTEESIYFDPKILHAMVSQIYPNMD